MESLIEESLIEESLIEESLTEESLIEESLIEESLIEESLSLNDLDMQLCICLYLEIFEIDFKLILRVWSQSFCSLLSPGASSSPFTLVPRNLQRPCLSCLTFGT